MDTKERSNFFSVVFIQIGVQAESSQYDIWIKSSRISVNINESIKDHVVIE